MKQMKWIARGVGLVGALVLLASFLAPPVAIVFGERADASIGIIGGADAPTFWLHYRRLGCDLLTLLGAVMVAFWGIVAIKGRARK